jgi:hypothetical protein
VELLIVDTTGIQSYIFGSNRLRENIGASYLVAKATGDWALETVREISRNACNVGDDLTLDATRQIENADHALAAEVIYAGGGNFVAIFADIMGAEGFERRLSERVLCEAPGLQLVFGRRTLTVDGDLAHVIDGVFRDLAGQKQCLPRSAPLLGVGVTRRCQSTGLPAIGLAETPDIGTDGNPGQYPVSAEILAKVLAAKPGKGGTSPADALLEAAIPKPSGFSYPREFEDLGGTRGEHSYIAIVHADGDDMAKRFQSVMSASGALRDSIDGLRQFSAGIQGAAQAALSELVTRLHAHVVGAEIAHASVPDLCISLPYDKATGALFLPFRPLVFGGDDVTFVCDGRMGLSLALGYLGLFKEHTKGLRGGLISSSAGIAIVKSHYPFARAYGLAEELCRSAKVYRHRNGIDESCLDWHFAQSGLSGGVDAIRKREYRSRHGDSMILRPLSIGVTDESHDWNVVGSGVAAFQGPKWGGMRNKIKALRDALREGSDAVEAFRNKYLDGEELPKLPSDLAKWPKRGWHGDLCGYFDAVELADWHIPLD